MPLKKHIIGCASLLLVLFGGQTANSCGWYPAGEEYRFCAFNPFVVPRPELAPFVFTTDKFLYNFTTNQIYDPVYRANVAEWAAYMHNNVPQKEIYHVLYDFDALKFLNYSATLAQTNSFVKFLYEHDRKAFDYLLYAKRCEQVLNKPDPWGDYFDFDIDMDAAVRLINEGEIMYSDTKSDFLKLHIAYQLEKLFFYEAKPVPGLKDDKRSVYKDKIVKSKIDSWIKNSAFYYYTITEWDSLGGYKNSAEEGNALAKAFDKAPDKRFRCVRLFDRRLKGALALAKTNHDKALLNIMYQLQNSGSGLNGMQTIYALEPTSQYIPFLLAREVNKLEDWLVTDKVTNMSAASLSLRTDLPENAKDWNTRADYTASRRKKDLEYLDNVITFINQLNNEKKQPNSGLLSLMASHLYIIKGDTVTAKQMLDAAAKEPSTDVVKKQIAVTRFMLKIATNTEPDAETEQLIMQLCKAPKPKYDDQTFFDGDNVPQPPTEDQLILYAGRKMMERGNYGKGILLLNKTQCILGMGQVEFENGEDIYEVMMETAETKDYKQLIALIDKKDKTPFEKFLVQGKIDDYPQGFMWFDDKDTNDAKRSKYHRPINKFKVLDYEATWYMNHDSLEQAYAAFAQIPDYYWNRQPYDFFKHDDPFTVSYLSTRQDTAVRGEKHWNKRTILKRMLQLKQEAETNPKKRAEDYLLLANAYYSFTYYGKYWIMNHIWWSGAEPGYDVFANGKFTPFDEMYYGTLIAKKYYLLGAQSGGSKATTCRCYYMAGACKENYDRLLWQMNHNWVDDFVVKNVHPYMNQLKQILRAMPDKKAVEDTTECTMYSDFLDVAFKK